MIYYFIFLRTHFLDNILELAEPSFNWAVRLIVKQKNEAQETPATEALVFMLVGLKGK